MSEQVEAVIGVIGRPHGLRGEVSIDLRTDEPERRFAVGAVVRPERGGQPFTVSSTRWHSGRLLVAFAELADRTAVEGARGTRLVVDVAADESPEEEGEFYDRQLIGLRVLDATGADVGEVTAVIHLPAQDGLEVQTENGTRLIPFVSELVPEVHLAAGHLRLADVPGLVTDIDDA